MCQIYLINSYFYMALKRRLDTAAIGDVVLHYQLKQISSLRFRRWIEEARQSWDRYILGSS